MYSTLASLTVTVSLLQTKLNIPAVLDCCILGSNYFHYLKFCFLVYFMRHSEGSKRMCVCVRRDCLNNNNMNKAQAFTNSLQHFIFCSYFLEQNLANLGKS